MMLVSTSNVGQDCVNTSSQTVFYLYQYQISTSQRHSPFTILAVSLFDLTRSKSQCHVKFVTGNIGSDSIDRALLEMSCTKIQAVIVVLACCITAAAEVFWSCPETHVTKEDRENVRGMFLAVAEVESEERKGNQDYDLINYELKYNKILERSHIYYYPPNPLKITARTSGNRRCGVTLERGKQYVVGYNGYFRFVVPTDTLSEEEKKLLENNI
ncbi:hypothetical protein Y032_0009g542 [Ancylostoma ceylanicum]|uniref:Uncharacterized protein n=1 Tax=Ancylostoma ceylanicum TaxID=53326 RepID=A0A016VK59_9BILA|nr:hypothetical protein Y032_0009g542 [Ancylostoma ceylanicum]